MFRKYDLLNAVIVAPGRDYSDPYAITYNPYKDKLVQIPNNVYKTNELFIEKNSNIFGKNINIVMYKDTITSLRRRNGSKPLNFNYDSFLPSLISEAMNATLILKTPYTNDLNMEDARNADLTINGRSYSTAVLKDVGIELTILLRRDDICVLVPYDRIRNTIGNMYRMVSPIVWVMVIVVIFLASTFLYTINRVQRDKTWNHVFLFDLFRFHMNQPLTQIPTQLTPRLVIALWLMYCVIINSVFQGSLYTSMSKNDDFRISTIDELLKTNPQLLVSNIFYNYSEYFLDNSQIKGHFELVDYEEYLNRIETNQVQYVYVSRSRGAKHFENIQIEDGLPVFYTMKECVVPSMTYYFVRRGSPYLKRINYLLRLAEESGLFNYWEEQLSHAYSKLKQLQRLFHHSTSDHFENFGSAFEIWSYGLVVAVGIFIIEWYAARLKLGMKKWFKVKSYRAHRTYLM